MRPQPLTKLLALFGSPDVVAPTDEGAFANRAAKLIARSTSTGPSASRASLKPSRHEPRAPAPGPFR
jgi:hypothetical protein